MFYLQNEVALPGCQMIGEWEFATSNQSLPILLHVFGII
jgi:hypothetical protein